MKKNITLICSTILISVISAEYIYTPPSLKNKTNEYFKNANEITGGKPVEVSQSYYDFIVSEIGGKTDWVKCYDSSTDSKTATAFHTACDGKGATVTIGSLNGKNFGGYSDIDWGSSQGYHVSVEAKLFSLDNLTSFSAKNNGERAVYTGNPNYGPAWGGGHDLNFLAFDAVTPNGEGYCYGTSHTYNGWSATYCVNSGITFPAIPNFQVYAVK